MWKNDKATNFIISIFQKVRLAGAFCLYILPQTTIEFADKK